MEYPSAQQSIRVLQEDNVRLLKLVQRYSCFAKLFIELCNDIQREEFFEIEKDYQIILNEIQCSTSESVHNKKSSLPLSFDSDLVQQQIHNYTISNSNINSIGLAGGNNVMENLPLFDELDVSGQFAMNGYLARAINQNNMHELFSRPIINSPTRQLSLDNESLILNQLNIPNQIGHMNTFQVESNDFSRTSEENNLIQILRTNQALSQQQQHKLYFPLADASQQQSPESCVPGIVKFTSNPFLNYTDVNTVPQQQDSLTLQHPAAVSASTASLQHHQTDQMIFGDPQSQQYDLNSDSNMSMLMRLSSATSSSSSLLPSMNSRMFVDQSQLQQAVQLQEQEQQQQQQQQQQLLSTIEQASQQQQQQEQLLQQEQEQQQLLQEQAAQQQLLQQEASRQQLLQQESSRQQQQLLQEQQLRQEQQQQLRQEQQQQLLRQEQLERQRHVPQSPHPGPNNGTINSTVTNGQLIENQIQTSRKESLPDSIRVYQHANEETLDLSQNMTDGIHLHRRKLKLTSNYHHSHLLNDNNNNNNNNNPNVSNNNNNNNSSHVNNNNSNSSHVNNGHNPRLNSSHVSNNNNSSVTQNNNNTNGLDKETLQTPQAALQASLQSQLESLSQTLSLSQSPLQSQTQSQSLSKSLIPSQTLSSSLSQSQSQSLSQDQSQTLSNSLIQTQSQSQSQHPSQSQNPLDARVHSTANQSNLTLKTDSPPATIIVDLSKNDGNFYDDCSMFSKENDKFPCSLGDCQEFFTDQMALSLHMKRKHGILRPFKCRFEGCKAEFKELHKLKQHGVVHTKLKPYKCDFPGCDARFSQSGHVSRHKKNHLQETHYLCTWEGCNKQFKQKHNLKIHHLSTHGPKPKPWACDVKGCNRAFVEKWKLVKHKKTHLRGVNANVNGQRDSQ